LPETAAGQLVTGVATGNITAIEMVPGITPEIIETVTAAAQVAYMESFKIVYYVGIAFGICSILSALAASSLKLQEVMTSEIPRKIQGIEKTTPLDEEKMA
jgi:hypothetical protein